MEEINYRGLDKLDILEVATIQRVSSKEFSKLKRGLGKCSLVLDVKKINREGRKAVYEVGRRAVYEVKARIDVPSIKFFADHSDWELERALHRTFDNLKAEIDHKFKKGKVKWPTRILKE